MVPMGGSFKSLIQLVERLSLGVWTNILLISREPYRLEMNDLPFSKIIYSKVGQISNFHQSSKLRLIWALPYFIFRLPIDIIVLGVLFKKHKIDIVMINNTSMLSVGIAAKIFRIKTIWYIREILRNNLLSTYQSWIIRHCADIIIANSVSSGKMITNKFTLIPNGLDLDRIVVNEDLRETYKLSKGKKIIASAGTMTETQTKTKGFYRFLEIAKMINLHDVNDEYMFMIFAEDKSGKEIKKLMKIASEFDIQDKIIFAGYQKNIFNALAIIDVLVLPIQSKEAFGRIVIESWALRVPLIVSDLEAFNLIITNGINGLLIPHDDVSGFAQAIQNVLKDDVLKDAITNNGYDTLENKYRIEKISDSFEELLNKLLNNY